MEIVRNDMPVWHDNLVSVKDKEILSLGHLVPLTVLKLRFNQNPTVKVVWLLGILRKGDWTNQKAEDKRKLTKRNGLNMICLALSY